MSNLRHDHVRIGELRLHVVESGQPDAQPIIFLHGWPQSWMEWHEVMQRAADEFRVIAIDLPGVGESRTAAADGTKHLDRYHQLRAADFDLDSGGWRN